MKNMNQIKLDAIVDSHRKKLINGARIIYYISMLLQAFSLYAIITDYRYREPYAIVFIFATLTGVFGLIVYRQHKRDFK